MAKDFLNEMAREQILVLNATYEPINITSWKRAFVLLLKEKAQLISSKVIRLLEYVRIPYSKLHNVRPSRSSIYERDGHKCQYCGSTRKLTIDHVIPRSKGGSDEWDNLVVACSSCNTLKGDRYLEQTGMKLISKPIKPTHIDVLLRKTKSEEWSKYCFEV